ncbi:MAG TPA: mechanosensitive channel MscK, partial [Pseudomonas sp.]|nr:mechanosensitive channel MscK [Pseudomonas sp.]
MSFLRTLLLSTLCLFVAPLHAQSLDSLTGTPPAAEGEAKPALSLGEQTQRLLQQTETSNKRAEELKALLAQAPKEITEAQRELAKLKASPDEDAAERYAKQSVEALEQRLSARVEELSEWQKQFSAANSMIITAQTRPERAQAQIGTAQTRIQEINNLLKNGRES